MTVSDAKIQETLALMTTGLSQAKACKEAGISVNTFRSAMERDPEAIVIATNTRLALLQKDFDDIDEANRKVIDELIKRTSKKKLQQLDNVGLFALEAKLYSIKERLNRQLGNDDDIPDNPDDNSAQNFLTALNKGPSLRAGKSVVTLRKTETTVEYRDDGDDDVIDAKAKDVDIVEEQQQS